jgi:protease-4
MGRLKAGLLGIVVVLLLGGPRPVCWGAENAEAEPEPLVVHFHLSGMLSEAPMVDPFGFMAGQITSTKSLIGRMDKAAEDEAVEAVVLTFDNMYFGFGQMEELHRAMNRLHEADKRIYVHAGGMTTGTYALLCGGDSLSIAPESAVWLTGLYGEGLYVKGLLDMIGVEADIMHRGAYKSAGEMFMRTGPSPEAEQMIDWMFDSYYETLVELIARSRDMTSDEVRELIDGGPYLAEEALAKDLVDAIETRDQFLTRLKKDIDGNERFDNRYGKEKQPQINFANPFAFFSVLSEMFKTPTTSQKDAVALIYVDGAILPGHSQPTMFGASDAAYSGDIRKALEKAAEDKRIKAVVMRVDSPGGSAEASEEILNAARTIKGNKPFVVSMGNMAASGGYYISCDADVIFANEATATASIGVVGGKLVTKNMWGKLGINWVGYKRGTNADIFTSNRHFSEDQRELFLDYMEDVYEVFKGHVARGRGDKLAKPLEEMAGGRVYTGEQALGLGLVDEIGGLHEAVEYAAAQASLDDYDVRIIPEPKDFLTMMMQDMSGQGDRPTDISTSPGAGVFAAHPALAPLLDLLRQTEPARARAVLRALRRIELLGHESVIMMTPFDIVLH